MVIGIEEIGCKFTPDALFDEIREMDEVGDGLCSKSKPYLHNNFTVQGYCKVV